jgi:hypothetical protein
MPIIPKGTAVSQIVHNGDATFITIPQSFADLSPFGAAGVVCDGVTDTTAAMQALLTSIGSKVTTLVFPNTGSCVLSNITFPVNITLDFTQSGSLQVVTGQTVTITGSVRAGLQQIFFNATPNLGTISLQSTQILCVYPEWWGAVPEGNAAINTNAIQAAIYGAYGTNRTNGSAALQFNRELHFSGLYGISGELKCYHMNGFLWTGGNRLTSGIMQTAGGNLRIIDGQSVSYGCFDNLSFSYYSSAPASTNCLIDLDYNGTQGNDLRPQFIDFRQCTFNGAGLVDTGVLIAKSGGGAQGSNIYFWDCNGLGFTGACAQIGGNNTGRNAGRFYAYNAIINEWWGGDVQGCPCYGLASYAGNWFVDGVSFENGILAQYANNQKNVATGYDVYCEGPQTTSTMRNVRSEGLLLAAGVGVMEYCETIMQATQFFGNAQWYGIAGSNSFVNQIITGTSVGGDGKYYLVSNVGAYGGTTQLTATGGTSTTIQCSTANFTPNAFVGMQVTVYPPTSYSAGAYGIVTANDATSVTCGAGWVTLDPTFRVNNPPAPPVNGQLFVVEPYWAGKPTSCGTVTFSLMTFVVISGAFGNTGILGRFENCYTAGGYAYIGGYVKNCSFSRVDWGGTGFALDDNPIVTDIDGVQIISAPGAKPKPWKWSRNSGGTSQYFGVSQKQMGTVPIVWSTGQYGGGETANDTWIGGRSDANSVTSVSRAVLEYGGVLGRATPIGQDQNGASTDIQGGLPTGAGAPGAINFWIGNSGVSGTGINDGSIVGSVTGAGLTLKSGSVVIATSTSPTSAATAGVTGQIAWDQGNIYLCVSGGVAGAAVWKKVALLSD